ncbi:MAG: hypothetical protein K8F91_26005 [Candidatus Obscuribacterales bacterium]|nr:hypothetical protein [Candidatus Obscuribacterales bacterium]
MVSIFDTKLPPPIVVAPMAFQKLACLAEKFSTTCQFNQLRHPIAESRKPANIQPSYRLCPEHE